MAKKKSLDKDFYINEIEILKWMVNEKNQKIRFSNRIEYKENNKLHRDDGPAIEFYSGVGDQYYIKGELYSKDEFINYQRIQKLNKIIE